MLDAAELARKVARSLDLHSYAARYRELNEGTERERILGDGSAKHQHSGDRIRARGYLLKQELGEIASWKSPRSKKLIHSNLPMEVEEISRAAFQLADSARHRPSIPASVLCILRGVHLPTASAVLMVWDPEDFGVLDIRAWSTLAEVLGPAPFRALRRKSYQRAFESSDYDLYLAVVRQLSRLTGLTCREVDMALYVYWDRETRGGNLYVG